MQLSNLALVFTDHVEHSTLLFDSCVLDVSDGRHWSNGLSNVLRTC